MRRMWMSVGVVAALALACGSVPDGGLPGGSGTGDKDQNQPPIDASTDGGDPGTKAPDSLWPLTTNSTWAYKITDPTAGVFEKHVVVLGQRAVPGTNGTAIAVQADEPSHSELGYEVTNADGVVLRVREEDSVSGAVKQVQTWSPAIVKSIASAKAVGWTNTTTVTETDLDGSGAITKEKDKTYKWTVVAVDETVTVPAGTFQNVVHLRRERTDKADYLREYWLAAGVGKVKETGSRTEELESFDVKP